MTVLRELGIGLLVVWGALFIALGSFGILRMPDLYSRLHAASKAATLGVAIVALALVIHFDAASVGFRAAAFGLTLFVTAPISAHLIARAGFLTGIELAPESIIDEAPDAEPDQDRNATAPDTQDPS
jgi:multicomponent Na+:H+ antiporter subunit G